VTRGAHSLYANSMAIATPNTETLARKEAGLRQLIGEYGPMAIAYSGGVDSSYLAAVAHDVLGEAARLVLADSPSIPRSEVRDACALAEARAWPLTVIQTQEFDNEAFLRNDGTRCYFCKSELFARMDAFAQRAGVQVLAYGEIADDAQDPTRLGSQAAREYRVVAPLAEAGLYKEEIRALSRQRGLPTAEKASFACLSSRFPKGTRVDIDAMRQVEAAEEVLRAEGFRQYRARHHGDLCRIECDPADISKLAEPEVRTRIVQGVQAAGYRHVTLDLAGYRTGSTAR